MCVLLTTHEEHLIYVLKCLCVCLCAQKVTKFLYHDGKHNNITMITGYYYHVHVLTVCDSFYSHLVLLKYMVLLIHVYLYPILGILKSKTDIKIHLSNVHVL